EDNLALIYPPNTQVDKEAQPPLSSLATTAICKSHIIAFLPPTHSSVAIAAFCSHVAAIYNAAIFLPSSSAPAATSCCYLHAANPLAAIQPLLPIPFSPPCHSRYPAAHHSSYALLYHTPLLPSSRASPATSAAQPSTAAATRSYPSSSSLYCSHAFAVAASTTLAPSSIVATPSSIAAAPSSTTSRLPYHLCHTTPPVMSLLPRRFHLPCILLCYHQQHLIQPRMMPFPIDNHYPPRPLLRLLVVAALFLPLLSIAIFQSLSAPATSAALLHLPYVVVLPYRCCPTVPPPH
ncbi:hypothetical protein BHE74_00043351, partial [Ensete ventricosum]